MIAKTHRFTRRQFEAARKRMKSFRSGPFLFLYRTDERLPTRLAVVVKKKTEKLAVNRNRFKRKVYQSLGEQVLPKFKGLQLICLHQGPGMKDDPANAIKAFATKYHEKTNG